MYTIPFTIINQANQIMSDITNITQLNQDEYVSDGKHTIILFSAPWCKPCAAIKPHFEGAEKELRTVIPKLAFVTVNVAEQKEIAQDYDIDCLPTIIITCDGKNMERIKGLKSQAIIIKKIRELYDIYEPSTKNNEP